jgi:hypothetical protein
MGTHCDDVEEKRTDRDTTILVHVCSNSAGLFFQCHSHVQRKHGSTGKDGKLVDAKVGIYSMDPLAPLNFITTLPCIADGTAAGAEQRGCEEEQAEEEGAVTRELDGFVLF